MPDDVGYPGVTDVPVDAQGNKTDPTGRSIDDFLRSLIPGAMPQSNAGAAAQPTRGDGSLVVPTGIQTGNAGPPPGLGGSRVQETPLPVAPMPGLEAPPGGPVPGLAGPAVDEAFAPRRVPGTIPADPSRAEMDQQIMEGFRNSILMRLFRSIGAGGDSPSGGRNMPQPAPLTQSFDPRSLRAGR